MPKNLQYIQIRKNSNPLISSLRLPASKSESNRALIIEALAGESGTIKNLSSARDTQTLKRLLISKDHILDVIDAGTTMRFLTAYLSVTNQDKILTGTRRMCERPIGILVDALRETGATIEYVDREGFPPIHIKNFKSGEKKNINMRGDVSSQFISAMLMIAPVLEKGLTIELSGKIGSKPYINLTLGLMKHFGVDAQWSGNTIHIPHQSYVPSPFQVNPDWSGASYWYSFASLADEANISLPGFSKASLQGDRMISEIMENLGVKSTFDRSGVILTKKSNVASIKFDFSDYPDLAQTVILTCAVKGIEGWFTGLESLKIKETDRIAALKKELSKIGADLIELSEEAWQLIPSDTILLPSSLTIETYDDHRMAMAFAPLATKMDVYIENPDVVAKSYPTFWQDLNKSGFDTRLINKV